MRLRSGTIYCRFHSLSICSALFFTNHLHRIPNLFQQIFHSLLNCTLHHCYCQCYQIKSNTIASNYSLIACFINIYCSFQLHCIRSNYLSTFFQLYLHTCSYEIGFPLGIRTLCSVWRKKIHPSRTVSARFSKKAEESASRKSLPGTLLE